MGDSFNYVRFIGYVFDKDGIDMEKLKKIMTIKNIDRGRIDQYLKYYPKVFSKKLQTLNIKCDIALPCATENELDKNNAKELVKNGCFCIGEEYALYS